MRKLKIFLDYQCYPLWVYNEQGELVSNELTDEFENQTEIREMLEHIQSTYDSLFIDNEMCFEYKGFTDETAKREFLMEISRVIQLIEAKAGNMHEVVNAVKETDSL